MRNGMRRSWMAGVALALAGALAVAAGAAAKKPAAAAAQIGAEAPGFALKAHDGKEVSLSALRGKTVVLEWFNEGCPVCARHAKSGTMKTIASKYADKGVVMLGVNSTAGSSVESNAKAAAKFALNYPVLDDSAGTVGKAYGAKCTPHMFVIDKEGKLAYAGAIDDDPDGGAAKVNYVEQALDELLAGKPVSTAETKPYGCGIKYAK